MHATDANGQHLVIGDEVRLPAKVVRILPDGIIQVQIDNKGATLDAAILCNPRVARQTRGEPRFGPPAPIVEEVPSPLEQQR